MRIVGIFLNPEIRTGGHKRYLDLLNGLSEKNVDVFTVVNEKLNYEFTNITLIKLRERISKLLPYSILDAFTVYSNRKQIIQTIGYCDYIIIFGETHLLSGILLKKYLRTKLCFALRSNGVVEAQITRKIQKTFQFKYFLDEFKYRIYEKIVTKYSDKIIVQSRYDYNSFVDRNKKSNVKTVVIYGNIGGTWYTPKFKDVNKSWEIKKILFVGALNERKGIIYLLYAFEKLLKENNKLELFIAGNGYLSTELKKYTEEKLISDNVKFLGKISNVFDSLASMDLLVVPSLFDSFPNVVLEGLHVGIPVLGTCVGGISEMLHEEDIVVPASVESLYLKIHNLVTNPEDYLEMKSRQKKNKTRFYFDWVDAFYREFSKEIGI